MGKTRKLTDADKAVTEGRLAVLLSRWAKAADAAMSTKLQAMREELRAEILSEMRAVAEDHADLAEMAAVDALGEMPIPWGGIIEINGAPTDSEGAE